jgi:butyrate response factor 1
MHEDQAFAIDVKTAPKTAQTKNANSDDGDVKYKTELCRNFELTRRCRYGNRCSYAHGKEELVHKKHINLHYKSKKCNKFFERGFCEYGARCQYLHKEDSHTHILDSYCEKLLVWIERNPHLDMSSIMKKTHAFGTRNSFFLKLEQDHPEQMDQSPECL